MSQTTRDTIQSTEELRAIVREEVLAALRDFTGDPDAGRTVSEEFRQRLEAARQVSDEDLIPFSEIKAKYS